MPENKTKKTNACVWEGRGVWIMACDGITVLEQVLTIFADNTKFKFLVRLHDEYNILVKLCGNTTYY